MSEKVGVGRVGICHSVVGVHTGHIGRWFSHAWHGGGLQHASS
jgi:hypothetical protein